MIVAVLDDLMFSSKIKTAAKQLGVSVVFARSTDAALAEMRKNAPTLVILDRRGIVRLYHPGQMTEEELEARLRPLLEIKN